MTASPGDGEHAAREGYYPDPSIPGYVRYWNGAAWVPGTSRPAPAPAPVEETGPVFLDETSATEALPDPGPGPGHRPPARDHAPAPAWQADPAHQAGFGGPRDVRVSWGGPDVGEPEDARPAGISLARPAAAPAGRRLPAQAAAESVGILPARPSAWPEAPGTGVSGLTSSWPEATARAAAPPRSPERPAPPADAAAPAGSSGPGGAGGAGRAGSPARAWPAAPAAPAPDPAEDADREWPGAQAPAGRSARAWSAAPAAGPAQAPAPAGESARADSHPGTHPGPGAAPAPGRSDAPAPASGRWPEPSGAPAGPARVPAPASGRAAASGSGARAGGQDPARPAPGARAGAGTAPAGSAAHAPATAHAPSSAPAAAPEREDARALFERMAERAVRPAGLVRRGLARGLDSLVLAGVAVAAALPLVPGVTAHLQAKVDAARAGGRTTTVWLLDATTAGRLGLVLAAVLLFGVFYEALPTARWGRTPGKKLCGVRVLTTAGLRPPGFGAALLRWLLYALLGLPGSLWCLVDRPRRQAWHDKAAGTYVAR
ncbi:RDD family protein [Streptomyces sp. NPDC096136]|uniref:RDD family protein n=1 Tax=Streptomyces sp. NPDC096136 TaxID=3366076 RepID=UPI00382BE0BF